MGMLSDHAPSSRRRAFPNDREVVVGERLQVIIVSVVRVVVIVCLLLILVDFRCSTDATFGANVERPLVSTTPRHRSNRGDQ